MPKEKLKAYSVGLQPTLIEAIQKSAMENSEGNVNAEIRRLIRKGLKDDDK